MSEHTALPWRTRRDGEQRIETNTGQYVGHAVDQTIAEHIVRCVNAHDELVAALEGVMAGFEERIFVRNTDGDDDPMWGAKLIPYLKSLADAQASLAKAKGSS